MRLDKCDRCHEDIEGPVHKVCYLRDVHPSTGDDINLYHNYHPRCCPPCMAVHGEGGVEERSLTHGG